jgi:hypothetical protein
MAMGSSRSLDPPSVIPAPAGGSWFEDFAPGIPKLIRVQGGPPPKRAKRGIVPEPGHREDEPQEAPESEAPAANPGLAGVPPAVAAAVPKAVPKAKAIAKAKAVPKAKAKAKAAAAAPGVGQVLGCSKCRHNPAGCAQCRRRAVRAAAAAAAAGAAGA